MSIITRPEVILASVVLAFLVVGWEQWIHIAAFGAHAGEEGGHLGHWLRDGSLTVLPALLAIGGGLWIADRLVAPAQSGGRLVSQAISISVLFGLLLVPMVAVHNLIDDFLGGEGGLGSLRVAPGAGYIDALAESGLEGATGFFGVLAHGSRDAALALVVVIPLAFICVAAIAMVAQKASIPAGVPQIARASSDSTAVGAVSRRDLLKYGGAGTVAVALSSAGAVILPSSPAHAATAADVTPWLIDDIELYINDGIINMIDGVPVYMWGYGYKSGGVDDADGLHTPGPVIWTYEGQIIRMSVTNNLDEDHSFSIDGVYDTGPIGPGESRSISFPAPKAGTYLYEDSLNTPVNRVLGLQGTMIVMPADGSMRLTEDLPKKYWTYTTQWVWMFNEIDPAFNGKAQAGITVRASDFKKKFKPRYFTINGRMGSLASHVETAPDTAIHAHLDEAVLIRIVNGGYAAHGPHIHGNHVFVLARNARLEDTIMWKDTFHLLPGDRLDIHLPYSIPPNAVRWPPDPAGIKFLADLHGRDIEGAWPMHCHMEMSQTAGGGLYPQGLLTDWTIEL